MESVRRNSGKVGKTTLKGKGSRSIAQWFRDLRLRYKLIIVYLCTGLLPVAAASVLTYTQIRSGMLERERQHMQSHLYQAVSAVDNRIHEFETLSQYIVFDQSISNVLNYEYRSVFDMYQQLVTVIDPMLASMKYFHHDAKQVTIYIDKPIARHGDTVAPLSEIADTQWYQQLQNASGVRWFIDPQEKTVLCASPMLRLLQAETQGVLCISIQYEDLFSSFDMTRDSNYGIIVVDETRNPVYERSFFEGSYESSQLTAAQLEGLLKAEQKTYEIVQESCPRAGWTAYLYKPAQLMVTSIEPAVQIGVMALLVFVAAATIAIILLNHFLTKRVERLRGAMELVREGHLETTIAADSRDEIGDLAEGFQGMLGRISVLIHEVYEGKLKEKEYEMKALQAQINPHFLYNTLSMINWKAIEAGEKDISRITLALSSFYRTALNKGKNITTLRSEISNMKSYLEIELMMHDNSFDVELAVEEDILQYSTLNLLLQPLIENAIVHGIDEKTDGRGKIRIEGRKIDNEIQLVVEDNGVGMEQEEAWRILTKDSSGYGVRNVNERIRLYYGEPYALKIESQVGVGTRATFRIPCRFAEG